MNELKRSEFCPDCNSEAIQPYSRYQMKGGVIRQLFFCQECQSFFSETKNTALCGLHTPLSRIMLILNTLTEGLGINAICRVFHVSKNSLYRWQERLSQLKETLLLYALCHQFLQHIVEGDELYTKVKKTPNRVNRKGGLWYSWIELPVSYGK